MRLLATFASLGVIYAWWLDHMDVDWIYVQFTRMQLDSEIKKEARTWSLNCVMVPDTWRCPRPCQSDPEANSLAFADSPAIELTIKKIAELKLPVWLQLRACCCSSENQTVYGDGTGGLRRKECSSLRAQLCTLCCHRQTASTLALPVLLYSESRNKCPPCFTHGLLSKSQETREQSWSRIFTCSYTDTQARLSKSISWERRQVLFFVAIREVLINLTICQVPGGRIGPRKHSSIFLVRLLC